jgi:Na+-transporting NADH:ubiquinone oxidoreductase subunit NqrE
MMQCLTMVIDKVFAPYRNNNVFLPEMLTCRTAALGRILLIITSTYQSAFSIILLKNSVFCEDKKAIAV